MAAMDTFGTAGGETTTAAGTAGGRLSGSRGDGVDAGAVVAAYWAACATRDWTGFGALLATEVVYELPQTRERIHGRDRFVRFNAEYPGDWEVTVERIAGGAGTAASWIRMRVGDEELPAASFFDLDEAGLIVRITEFWPEPYEPPAGREHLAERY